MLKTTGTTFAGRNSVMPGMIGTRIPIFLPQRITPELCDIFRKYGPIWMSIHVNHPKETTAELRAACERLKMERSDFRFSRRDVREAQHPAGKGVVGLEPLGGGHGAGEGPGADPEGGDEEQPVRDRGGPGAPRGIRWDTYANAIADRGAVRDVGSTWFGPAQ